MSLKTTKAANQLHREYAVFKLRGDTWTPISEFTGGPDIWSYQSKSRAERYLKKIKEGRVMWHSADAQYKVLRKQVTWVED